VLGKTRIESAPDGRRPISLAGKRAGEPSAGNGHARFEVAGAGNQLTVRIGRHSQRKRGANKLGRTYGALAPVLDPTAVSDGSGRKHGGAGHGPDRIQPSRWLDPRNHKRHQCITRAAVTRACSHAKVLSRHDHSRADGTSVRCVGKRRALSTAQTTSSRHTTGELHVRFAPRATTATATASIAAATVLQM